MAHERESWATFLLSGKVCAVDCAIDHSQRGRSITEQYKEQSEQDIREEGGRWNNLWRRDRCDVAGSIEGTDGGVGRTFFYVAGLAVDAFEATQ